jgi:hypothetical protein
MGVEDNKFDISELTASQTFLEWFNKTNDEIITKLNTLEVFDGASGDGIDVSVGTTLGSGTAGIMLVQMSGNVTKGVTFQDITVNGELNYSFNNSETKSIVQITGSTFGSTAGFTFGNAVRVEGGNTFNGITLARAFNGSEAEALGLVNSIDDEKINIVTNGRISGDFTTVAGGTLHAGCVYFLHPTDLGKLSRTEPSSTGQVSKPVLVGITGDTGVLLNYRGQELGFTGATGESIGSLTILLQLASGEAAGFNVGQFVSKNTALSGSLSDGRGVTSNVYFASAGDPFQPESNVKQSRSDLFGVIKTIDTNTDILEILIRGFYPKTDLQTDGVISSSPFFLSNGLEGKVGTGKTNVQLGHLVDASTVFIDPFVFEDDRVFNANNRDFLTGSGVSFGIESSNPVINGSYDIWQRNIGTSTAFQGTTASSSLYFADRWVFLNGMTAATPATGNFSIERFGFTAGQTDVLGEPTYFARVINNYTGLTTDDFVHVENRLDSSEYFLGQDAVISVYTKSAAPGSTLAVLYKQYYDNGVGNPADSITTRVGEIELAATFTPAALSFSVPGLSGNNITGTDHYAAIAFDIKGVTGKSIDFAQLQFEKGTLPTIPKKKNVSEVLNKCRKFYQRSYNEEISTRSTTMELENVPDLSVVDIPVNHSLDYYYKFPVEMRKTPEVTLYSPNSGVTSDGFNRLANKDMRLTSGTIGPNNQVRESLVNQPTIQVGSTADNGIRFEIVSGAVVGDQISVHYVADADVNKNL